MINRIWSLKQQYIQVNGYAWFHCKGSVDLKGKESSEISKWKIYVSSWNRTIDPWLIGRISGEWVSEWIWLFNVTYNDISVIYVTAHRCAGGLKKKLNLRSGSQRHRHFVGFFNVPVQAPTRDPPFYGYSEKPRPLSYRDLSINSFWIFHSIPFLSGRQSPCKWNQAWLFTCTYFWFWPEIRLIIQGLVY